MRFYYVTDHGGEVLVRPSFSPVLVIFSLLGLNDEFSSLISWNSNIQTYIGLAADILVRTGCSFRPAGENNGRRSTLVPYHTELFHQFVLVGDFHEGLKRKGRVRIPIGRPARYDPVKLNELEIIKPPVWDPIIEILHHVPRPVTCRIKRVSESHTLSLFYSTSKL